MNLCEWLKSLDCFDVSPVRVTIGKSTYEGAEYRQKRLHKGKPYSDSEDWIPIETYEVHALYLLGELPASYRRSSKTCYVRNGDGRDWFVAGYYDKADVNPLQPFGRHFLLQPWTADLPIDQEEGKPRERMRIDVQSLEA